MKKNHLEMTKGLVIFFKNLYEKLGNHISIFLLLLVFTSCGSDFVRNEVIDDAQFANNTKTIELELKWVAGKYIDGEVVKIQPIEYHGAIKIVGWHGINPEWNETLLAKRYQDAYDAGFDISLWNSNKSWYYGKQGWENLLLKNLDNSSGMQLIVKYDSASCVPNHSALYGCFIEDEPSPVANWDSLKQVNDSYSDNFKYINAFPRWASTFKDDDSYEKYIDDYIKTGTSILSFTQYPFYKNGGINEKWLYNLNLFRKKSEICGKDFWGLVLSTGHVYFKKPTIQTMRAEAFTNLVFGAKAIQYFTLSQPIGSTFDNTYAAFTRSGEKTDEYYRIMQVNREIINISQLFRNSKILNVYLNNITNNFIDSNSTSIYNVELFNNKKIIPNIDELSCSEDAVFSLMEHDGELYLNVVNLNYAKPAILHIKGKSCVSHISSSDFDFFEKESLQSLYKIKPGDICVFNLGKKNLKITN